MPTRRLPSLDSFDYQYLIYQQRRRLTERERCQRSRRRQRLSRTLGRLAAAMAFLHNGTVLRGMQLELH